MTLWHAITAIMIGLYQHDWPSYPGQAKVGLSMLFLFMFSFGIGWGPVPWALPSEIHSTSTRAKGVALSVVSLVFSFFHLVGMSSLTPHSHSSSSLRPPTGSTTS